MLKKLAILLDWENVRKQVFEAATRKLKIRVDYNEVENVVKFARAFVDTTQEEIYRIFVYLAAPLREVRVKGQVRDFSEHPAYLRHVTFVERLGQQEYVAMRKGRLQFRGIKPDGNLDLVQKQVDLLIGIDISDMSYRKLVDRILVLAYDTDIIPALKIARKNGVQIVLGFCPELHKPSRLILHHVDLIRETRFSDIFAEYS